VGPYDRSITGVLETNRLIYLVAKENGMGNTDALPRYTCLKNCAAKCLGEEGSATERTVADPFFTRLEQSPDR